MTEGSLKSKQAAPREDDGDDDENKSGNTNLQDTGVWADPGRHGWRVFEGGTSSTLRTQYCEDDSDDDNLPITWQVTFASLLLISETV